MQSLKNPPSTSASFRDEEPVEEQPYTAPIPDLDDPGGAVEPVTTTVHGARPSAPDIAHRTYKINHRRYLRIVAFFGWVFYSALFWEVVVRRVLGESFVAPRRSKRYRGNARAFRQLAISMGGVLIKLGQFISSRVDVLPPEITEELEGLQDQVPIVDFAYIKKTIESNIGPLGEKFAWLNSDPVAAASFGQVHRAQLPNGDRVVVKVQRPNISEIVHTDLTALEAVARFAMRFSFISRRANVPALLDEFSRVLWEELDYLAEADHALTFASMFRDNPGVYIPAVYLDYTTPLVLTLEDVTSIKLNDYAALERAGIDRREVARRLLNTYLYQVFEERFFHADPHPGNIFIYPLPADKSDGSTAKSRPFYLIFVDFGMVGRLTPQIQEGLRETLIAVATQDVTAMVSSYQKLGVLLPGTDTKRLEEATRAVFDKVWGLNMTQLASMRFEDMSEIAREFSDLLLSMPFQMPQDFIYLGRAMGILSGMCTGLDPQFDPWREMQPFTQKLLSESSERTQTILGGAQTGLQVTGKLVQEFFGRFYKLPGLTENVLNRADRGELEVRLAADDELRGRLDRIEQSMARLPLGIVFATMALASTVLYVNHETGLGVVGYGLSGIALLLMWLRGRE